MTIKDQDNLKHNFSQQSRSYRKFRPTYSRDLINQISAHAPVKKLAWDCGTGNGQAAFQLAHIFDQVIATDVSERQIAQAVIKDNIRYRIESGEYCSLKQASVDLLLIAQAIHWFDFEKFYLEVNRVVKKGGIISVLGYPLLTTSNEELNNLLRHFYHDIVGPYWDPERRYLDERYETIPFPYEEIPFPKYEMTYRWSAAQFLGYLESWSSVQHYKRKNATDPLILIKDDLQLVIPIGEPVEVRFEIIGRIGRV